eukprot:2039713-Prymnesium_polylepis.1
MDDSAAALLGSLEHALDILDGRPAQTIIDRLSGVGDDNDDGMSHRKALSQLEEQLDDIALHEAKAAVEGLHGAVATLTSREDPTESANDLGHGTGAPASDHVEERVVRLSACIPAFVRAAQRKESRHIR